MALVTEAKPKTDWLATFAPNYFPMQQDINQAAVDAMDIGVLRVGRKAQLQKLNWKFLSLLKVFIAERLYLLIEQF